MEDETLEEVVGNLVIDEGPLAVLIEVSAELDNVYSNGAEADPQYARSLTGRQLQKLIDVLHAAQDHAADWEQNPDRDGSDWSRKRTRRKRR